MHARKLRDIQKNQINQIFTLIGQELQKLFPSLTESEAFDWTNDISNCDSNKEVVETLLRINSILDERQQFKCSICGKSTIEVEYDYLYGKDHLECHLKKQFMNKVEGKNTLESIAKRLESIEDRLANLKQ